MKKILSAALVMPLISGGALFNIGPDTAVAQNGKSDYVIVRPDACDFAVKAAASNLSKAIKKATGVEIKVITDKTAPTGAPYYPREILIGNTSRVYSQTASKGLLYNDYAVRVYGNTVAVAAGNDSVYDDAVKYITDNLISEDLLVLKNGYNYVYRSDYEIDSITLCGKDVSQYTVVVTDDAYESYAGDFSATLLEKTGRTVETDTKTQPDRSEIVFGGDVNGLSAAGYSVSAKNGDVVISSPSDMGFSAAYAEFSQSIFNNGESDIKMDTVNIRNEVKPTAKYEKYITARTPLTNTLTKLKQKKQLTVAYFGGSVTVGHGATDREKYSWRARTSEWLTKNFPDAEIISVNAAIGATGSHLGAFRTERDIISQKPDLLFVEFSVNDSYNRETAESAAENYEAIVRRVRKALPECDIVNVYITDSGKTSAGGNFVQKQGHEKIAAEYGIPALDVGRALAVTQKLAGNSSPAWKDYFTDIVHMTDKGYGEYFATISEYLANELIFADAGKISKHPLPALVMPGAERTLHYDLVTAEMAAKFENCSFVEGSVFDKLSHTPYLSYLLVNQPGNKITVKFTGTELALLMSDYTSGTVKYTVDGKNGSEVRNSMNNPFPLISGLEYGEHTAVIEICFDKDSKSAKLIGFLSR